MDGQRRQALTTDEVTLRHVVARGWRRLCPRCGRAPVFRGWLAVREACQSCGLRFAPKPGDTWGFWVLGDRVFVIVPVILIYFGLAPLGLVWRSIFLAAIIATLVWTMPHRMGVCIGLDYLARLWSGEES